MTKSNSLPQFSTIDTQKIFPELQQRLAQNRERLKELLKQENFTFENLLLPLDEMQDNLHNFWSIIGHLNNVINSDDLRAVYNQCLPLLSDYYTELSHNEKLYQAVQHIHTTQYQKLNHVQRKIIDNELRDFKLAGVALPPEQKKQFAQLIADLTQLSTKFEENLLDATKQWEKLITDPALLSGIPEFARTQAKERAETNKQEGWLFTLETPSYLAVITHADSRELREEIYRAYVTRASDLGAKEWDNSSIMNEILTKRLELANLLDLPNYAALSLTTKMAKSSTQVFDFLSQLVEPSYPKAMEELKELKQFSQRHLNLDELKAWDIAYASEKMRQHDFDISEEELRPYFAEPNVIEGLFTIVKKLFQVDVRHAPSIDTWHPDVRCYALYDSSNTLRSYCYFDLYARPNKRGGAWMDDCKVRRRLTDGTIQIPIAFVTCNFGRPTANQPALFSHEEVLTLFHEFGHALQHMLTTIDYAPVSGIHGIPWDAVELPSQFMENWAWEKESLMMFAKHFQTNKPLPKELFEKLNRAKNFHSAMQMVRQLEFALFDFKLHNEFDPKKENQIQMILDKVRAEVSVVPIPSFNRFQHSFAHIFSGGYAAGYYSYKWAEVMSSDAFSLFIEKGIFDLDSALKFLHFILEPGGSEDPAVLFKKFRGHEPDVSALLQQSGIRK